MKTLSWTQAHDVMVIPHGSSVYSYHLQTAFAACPVAEFLNQDPDSAKIVPYFGAMLEGEPLPENGSVVLDAAKSGFGVTLVREGLRRPYERPAEESEANAAQNRNGLPDPPLGFGF